jgi:hypothetical protein
MSLPLSAAAQPGQPEVQGGAAPAPAGNDELPIKRITLYRSGVGYFERAGSISGDIEVQLRFKTEEINDILKSMVLVDLDGGRIDAVSYGSKEPLQRRLASFGVDISKNPTIPDLLNQLRGAPIKVVAPGEQIQGTILGVETRTVPPPKDQEPIPVPHLNLVTINGLRSIAVPEISSFEILDKELAGELNKALAALAEYRADRTKTVDLNFGGQGTRRVVVGYVQEMPVWKTSYRLILPDDVAAKAKPAPGGKPTGLAIKGWAIVENNTDNDWNDVRLALVSGRPVSFEMDLYEPLFVDRPDVPVPTIPGVAPRAYQGGVEAELGQALAGATEEARRAMSLRERASAPAATPPAAGAAFRPMEELAGKRLQEYKDRNADVPAMDLDQLVNYSAAAQAQGGEVGEVFQYELDEPVTIERQRSAMIPILSASLTGRRVSIFSIADGSEHPMRGVEVTNDSDLQLLPGPIAVFDGSEGKTAYAGDAQIGHIAQGDKRLLAYAVDLDVKTLTSTENDSNITHLKIVNGLFEQTVKTRSSMTYAFQNDDEKRARTIIVEHARLPGWKLVAPEKPAEETQTLYRFEVPVEASKKGTLSVVQEQVQAQQVGITSYDLATILRFHKDGKLSDKVLEAVREVARRQGLINDAERAIQELDRQVQSINTDQNRIRENMARIDKTSQLYGRYMTKLTEQETQLEDLTQKRLKGQEDLEKMRQELNAYISALNVE